MVKLYMNPEKLAGKIKTLRSLATSATINKGLIDTRSEELHDPMEAEPIDTYLSSVQTAIEAVNSRADEIEKCKKTIEDLRVLFMGLYPCR